MTQSYTERFSEGFQLLGKISADSQTVVQDTGNANVENFHRVVAIIDVGDLAGGASLNADLEQASSSAAGTRKAITGKSITALADTDDDVTIVIELQTEELDVENGFSFVNLEVTAAGAAVEYSATLWGYVSRFQPVSTTALEEVVT